VALFFVFVALSFVRLTVRDEGDCLAIRFGVLPVFRKCIPYSAIEAVVTHAQRIAAELQTVNNRQTLPRGHNRS